jgi:transposase
MSYDRKFRERVLEHVKSGKTQKEVGILFGLGANTITQWKKLLKETGKLENRELERNFKKIDPEKLKRDIAERPDDFDKDRAVRFNCTKEAIRTARKKLKITRKKNNRIR